MDPVDLNFDKQLELLKSPSVVDKYTYYDYKKNNILKSQAFRSTVRSSLAGKLETLEKDENSRITLAENYRLSTNTQTPKPDDVEEMNTVTKNMFIQREESKNEVQWKNVTKYWRADFRENAKLKKPLINQKKR